MEAQNEKPVRLAGDRGVRGATGDHKLAGDEHFNPRHWLHHVSQSVSQSDFSFISLANEHMHTVMTFN